MHRVRRGFPIALRIVVCVAATVMASCGGGGSQSLPSPGLVAPVPAGPGASPTPTPTPAPGASPSISVVQYAAANPIDAIAAGPDGNVWFTEKQETVGMVNVASGSVASYHGVAASQENCSVQSAPPSQQSAGPLSLGPIIAGPNGTLWYAAVCGAPLQYGYSGFNQMSTSGSVTMADGPAYNAPNIFGVTTGSDGNVWATEEGPEGFYLYGWPQSGSPTICNDTQAGVLQGVTNGPDGALWMPTNQSGKAALLRSTTSCSLTTVVSLAGVAFDARSIASAGSALWVIDVTHNALDKFTTAGSETTIAVPKTWVADSQGNVGYVASSPAGTYVYFDDGASATIGRVNVSSGQVQEFSLPAGTAPQQLAIDASGNVWTFSGSTIVKVTFTP